MDSPKLTNMMKGFDLPSIKPHMLPLTESKGWLEGLNKNLNQKQKEEQEYKQAVLDALLAIEKNTADISTIVALVNRSNENQEKILDAVNHIMLISTAKNKEEADSLYRKSMDKAQQCSDDVETITKLLGYAKVVWLSAKAIIDSYIPN